MRRESEYRMKVRLLRVMRAILEQPYVYTTKQLSKIYNVDRTTISRDLKAIINAGFVMDKDGKHRHAFVEDGPYKELNSLLHFTDEEQFLLEQAIDQISSHTGSGKKLKRKLGSLYDFSRLGHSYLKRTNLSKIDALMKAEKERMQVVLVDYPSGHGDKIADRHVEPFHTNPGEDMVHAFDVEKKQIRHFRISRIKRVKMVDTPWTYENRHSVQATDPFRIVNNNQVMVRLRMKVGARNLLLEQFPLTKNHIEPTEDEGIFELQCKVNHKFLGLSNFILGNYHFMVEVLEPESLLEHLRETVRKMEF